MTGFNRAHLGLLLDLASKIVDVRPVGTSHPVLARDLLGGYPDACLSAGQDALVENFDPEEPEARLVALLGERYDERGPRNTKSRILVDSLLAAVGVELADDPTPAISLDDDVRKEVLAAATSVLEPAFAPEQLRERIIAAARSATDPAHHATFDKIAAQLDPRGLAMVKQPKVPLEASQAIQRHLTAARESVIGGVARTAIDRAKDIIARTDADAAARIDTPISLRLTPRDVAVRRIFDTRIPKTSAAIVPALVDALAQVARITWRAEVKQARTYSAKDTFAVGELIDHPKFGRGSVTSVAAQRIEVEFPDGTRALVHAKT